jgi:hypothetical protein
MSTSEEADTQPHHAKAAPGASWAAQETQVIPKNNLLIVFIGLALSVFLAAIDQVRWHASLPNFLISTPAILFYQKRPSSQQPYPPLSVNWAVETTTVG